MSQKARSNLVTCPFPLFLLSHRTTSSNFLGLSGFCISKPTPQNPPPDPISLGHMVTVPVYQALCVHHKTQSIGAAYPGLGPELHLHVLYTLQSWASNKASMCLFCKVIS